MKKSDIVIIGLVLLIAFGFILFNNYKSDLFKDEQKTAIIQVEGEIYKTVPLTKDEQTIEVKTNLGTNIIKIHDDGVEIIDADCPDKVCVDTGFVESYGASIVCLPNKLIVEVKGEKKVEIDELSN